MKTIKCAAAVWLCGFGAAGAAFAAVPVGAARPADALVDSPNCQSAHGCSVVDQFLWDTWRAVCHIAWCEPFCGHCCCGSVCGAGAAGVEGGRSVEIVPRPWPEEYRDVPQSDPLPQAPSARSIMNLQQEAYAGRPSRSEQSLAGGPTLRSADRKLESASRKSAPTTRGRFDARPAPQAGVRAPAQAAANGPAAPRMVVARGGSRTSPGEPKRLLAVASDRE